jgi:hypothetical protein
MKATNKEISEHFSKGNFPFCYDYFAENMEWNLVGNDITKGRNNVIEHCDKMMIEMATATLKIQMLLEKMRILQLKVFAVILTEITILPSLLIVMYFALQMIK